MDKVRSRTPAALRMEANRTPDLVLLDFLANIQGDLECFELAPTPVVGPASLAQEVLEQEGLVEVEQQVGATVEQLELDYTVDVVELGQSLVVTLVAVAVIVGIVEETFDYFVEQVSDVEVLD